MNSPSSAMRQRVSSETNMTPIKNNLEGCCYRRRSDQATLTSSKKLNEWSYHNHILQGGYLRFIRQPILQKEAAAFRQVLVAGKAKGRFTEMTLGTSSEISMAKLSGTECPPSSPYVVNVSGICTADSSLQHWQLAFPSAQQQAEWAEALTLSKSFTETLLESLEYDKLKRTCKKMLHEIDIRTRIRGFKIHRGVFIGSMAVKWLSSELGVSSSQSVIIGNQMLNCNLFYHVAREHLFCDSKLYYRFSKSVFDADRADDTTGSRLKYERETESKDHVIAAYDLERLRLQVAELQENVLRLQRSINNSQLKEIKQDFFISMCLITVTGFVINQVSNGAYAMTISISSIFLLVISLLLAIFISNMNEEVVESSNVGLDFEVEADSLVESLDDSPDGDITDDYASDYELMLDEEEGQDEEDDNDPEESPQRVRSASMEGGILGSARRSSRLSNSTPPVSSWPHRPILIRRSSNMLLSTIDEASVEGKSLLEPLRVYDNGFQEIPLESDLFSGKMILIFHNVSCSPVEYFRYCVLNKCWHFSMYIFKLKYLKGSKAKVSCPASRAL